MHDTTVSERPAARPARSADGWLSRESMIWPLLVAIAFLAAELTPALLRMPLGADEITYIARTSTRVSGVDLPPVHGHGAGLLAAPVTLLTGSLIAVRIWMALLSAAALFLAMLCWRGLRPAWVVALAGLILGSMAITQLSGVQVYPDWWAAVAIMALTGLFLQATSRRWRPVPLLLGIGLCAFVIVLMRPQNIVFVLAPVFVAGIVVPGWRRPSVLAAIAAGAVLGIADWVGEAYLWYGGLANRIHLANQEPPKLGLYFSFPYQVKVLSGPWYCEPVGQRGSCTSWDFPWLTLWWVALVMLAFGGLMVAWRRATRASSVLAAATAVWVVVLYSFLVPFGAPRYFLPAYVFVAILAADAIAWLVTEARWRDLSVAASVVFLLAGIVSQRVVLDRQISSQDYSRRYAAEAARLERLGVHAPCVIYSPSVAYYIGCSAPWTGESITEALRRTPQGAGGWQRLHAPGLGKTKVYVPKTR